MWEEEPEHQKAQAKMSGLLASMVFIGSVIYCASKRDWDLLWLVLYAGAGLIVALAIFPLAAWVVVKVVAQRRIHPAKPQSNHET